MKKVLLIVTLALALTLVTATAALAAGIYVNPGDAGYEIPHGGYSTSTDACLQCHDVHESAGDYVLMRWSTVTDVCGSCHSLYQAAPGGLAGYSNKSAASALGAYQTSSGSTGPVPTYDPGFANQNAVYGVKLGGGGNNLMLSTSSQYAVYEVTYSSRSNYGAGVNGGHRLSQGGGSIKFGNGVTASGDYIPGGSNPVQAIKPADYDNTVDALNFTATNGLYCAACHTPHGNFGQMLLGSDATPSTLADNPVVSTKLLSAKPNHIKNRIWIDPKKGWITEGGKWCAGCHDRRIPGAVYHNHPDFACLQCHGNYVGSNAAYTGTPNNDFPHTSKIPFLLTNEPDDVCITCHVPGTLP